ncbi:unnamed protein product [Oreochromis niloticus]|nr:unnamed protein product [Mustela putorius furo]CAI5635390.1 unnamed protein product [Mustela putorius furo]CAI5635391.1 unnamed protein product [Mustela putorius furo]CAI5635392.1 unnamed protein product [Mustela putorius furo]CAI5635393.1 unnamed protein product [Mustela putorius furo]
MASAGWTVVRYGKRRKLSRNRDNQQGGFPSGGMARAFPASQRWQAQSPSPNLPVPRSGGPTRYRGPQSRSYASVARSNAFQTVRFIPRRQVQGVNQDQRRPADPAFGGLVRRLYGVIKMVHHLQNVAPAPGKDEPRTISRMVEHLGNMIKPAAPTAHTTDMILGNAMNWGHNTLIILEDHYRTGLEKMLAELANDLVPDWKAAFNVATRWAHRNLPRMKNESIEHAEAMIASCRDDRGVTQDQPQMVRASSDHPTARARTDGCTQTGDAQSHGTQTVTPTAPQQQQREEVEHGTVQSGPKSHTVATMTGDIPEEGGTGSTPQGEGIQGMMPWSPDPGEGPSKQPRVEPPKGRRTVRGRLSTRRRRSPAFSSSSSSTGPLDDDRILAILADLAGESAEEGQQEGSERNRMNPATQNESTEEVRVPSGGFQGDEDQAASGQSPQVDTSVAQEASPQGGTPVVRHQQPKFKVRRHIVTERKMVDWGLSVGCKWLIIGDSNLSRIPPHSIPDLQIESYPGANFRHIQAIIAKATKHVTVEKVVLSAGINSKQQKARETAIKQLQAAVRAAKLQFPYAEIWVPVINFSPGLPREERGVLDIINTHIYKNMPFLPPLPHRKFGTEGDLVHWTRETGRAMLEHWSNILNLKSRRVGAGSKM